MDNEDINLTEIERQIAATAENLRELIEQAAAYSGATGEELVPLHRDYDSLEVSG